MTARKYSRTAIIGAFGRARPAAAGRGDNSSASRGLVFLSSAKSANHSLIAAAVADIETGGACAANHAIRRLKRLATPAQNSSKALPLPPHFLILRTQHLIFTIIS